MTCHTRVRVAAGSLLIAAWIFLEVSEQQATGWYVLTALETTKAFVHFSVCWQL